MDNVKHFKVKYFYTYFTLFRVLLTSTHITSTLNLQVFKYSLLYLSVFLALLYSFKSLLLHKLFDTISQC